MRTHLPLPQRSKPPTYPPQKSELLVADHQRTDAAARRSLANAEQGAVRGKRVRQSHHQRAFSQPAPGLTHPRNREPQIVKKRYLFARRSQASGSQPSRWLIQPQPQLRPPPRPWPPLLRIADAGPRPRRRVCTWRKLRPASTSRALTRALSRQFQVRSRRSSGRLYDSGPIVCHAVRGVGGGEQC